MHFTLNLSQTFYAHLLIIHNQQSAEPARHPQLGVRSKLIIKLSKSNKNEIQRKHNPVQAAANEIQSELKQTNPPKSAIRSTKMCKPIHSKAKISPDQIQTEGKATLKPQLQYTDKRKKKFKTD
jgi:hypothetical protein